MSDRGDDPSAWLTSVAQNADREAFAQLFAYFAPRLKAYMRKLGADDAAAEELAQEAMLSVWRRAASYDPARAAVSTWIFTIARNKRIDAIRRARRPELDPNDPTLFDEPPRPDAEAMRRSEAVAVRAAVADLPDDQADAIRLAYDEGLSQTEIAARLDIPLGTVKSRLKIGLRELKKIYDP